MEPHGCGTVIAQDAQPSLQQTLMSQQLQPTVQPAPKQTPLEGAMSQCLLHLDALLCQLSPIAHAHHPTVPRTYRSQPTTLLTASSHTPMQLPSLLQELTPLCYSNFNPISSTLQAVCSSRSQLPSSCLQPYFIEIKPY